VKGGKVNYNSKSIPMLIDHKLPRHGHLDLLECRGAILNENAEEH